ncbi:MAG: phytanoyl-CoA dioxygenase family protein [Fimbriimonadaceae bacterium]|nr:phytanoyl-CoA dioxygenase family protein [Fimbriimonadaceae bacterium]
MLTADQVATFARDGCLNGGRVIDDATVAELNSELAQVIAGTAVGQPVRLINLTGNDATPVWQIVNICDASPAFRRLVHHPTIVAMIGQLIDDRSIRLWHDQIQYKPAATGGVNMWHQDGPFWPPLGESNMVTAWVALDDVDVTNGCMSMVPGSHRWGNCRDYLGSLSGYDQVGVGFTPPAGEQVEVTLWPVRRGEVSFHHCLTWHGSHANTSGRPRRAIALHYMAGRTPFVAAGEHLMKPFITSADGEPVRGERFYEVWRDGAVVDR